MTDRPRAREGLDPATLPATARWVLSAETKLRNAGLPPLLRRDGDPSRPSPSLLIAAMLGVGAAAAFVFAGMRESPGLGIAFAPVAAALWAGTIVGLEPGRLARVRFGPWLPAAGSWLGALFVVEVLVQGIAEPRAAATAIEVALAAGTGLVAWGKARLDLET